MWRNIISNKEHILTLRAYCNCLDQHGCMKQKFAWPRGWTENSLYISKSNLRECSCFGFITNFSVTVSAHNKMIHLSRWRIPCMPTTPSSSGCIIRKQRTPTSHSASPNAQGGRGRLENLMWPVLIIFTLPVFVFFAVLWFVFPIKQFRLT
jgi:hypothetical protein